MVLYLKYRQPCRQPGCQLVALTRVLFGFCQTFCFLFTLQVTSYDSAWTPDFSGITEGCWIRFLEKKERGLALPGQLRPDSDSSRVTLTTCPCSLSASFFFGTRVNARRSRCENSFTMLKALVNGDRIHLLRKGWIKWSISLQFHREPSKHSWEPRLLKYTSWVVFFLLLASSNLSLTPA